MYPFLGLVLISSLAFTPWTYLGLIGMVMPVHDAIISNILLLNGKSWVSKKIQTCFWLMCIKFLAECLAYNRHLHVTPYSFLLYLFTSHPTSISSQYFRYLYLVYAMYAHRQACIVMNMCWS